MEKQPFGVVLKPQFDTEKFKVGMPIFLKKNQLAISTGNNRHDEFLRSLPPEAAYLIMKIEPLSMEVYIVTESGDSRQFRIPIRFVADNELLISLMVCAND
jgi:hypothetical protein